MFKRYLPIMLLSFVNIIGFTLLIPILPDLVKNYTAPEHVGIVYGALLSSYALFQFLGAPILGSLSDKYGRKPILLISQLGTTLSWVVFGLGLLIPNIHVAGISIPLLVIAISRVIDGITGGNVSVAQAWVSDVTSREEKTKAFGMMGGVFGLGFLIGPALGGFTSTSSLEFMGTILVAFAISVITLGFIHWQLPESLDEDQRDHELELEILEEINVWKQIQKFKDNMLVHTLLRLRIFYALVFASYTTILILFLEAQFALNPASLGLLFSCIGLFSVFNQMVVAGKVAQWLGNLRALLMAVAILGIALAMIPFIPLGITYGSINVSLVIFMVNTYFINLGLSVGQPTFQALVTNSVSDRKQGAVTGLDESLLAIGRGISPLIAGGLYTFLGNGIFYFLAAFLVIPYFASWYFGKLSE